MEKDSIVIPADRIRDYLDATEERKGDILDEVRSSNGQVIAWLSVADIDDLVREWEEADRQLTAIRDVIADTEGHPAGLTLRKYVAIKQILEGK